jgi:hypothetical protein
MYGLAKYLYAWNDWIVMPGLLVSAVYAFIRLRTPSMLLAAFGALLYVASCALQIFYPSPLSFAYNAALLSQYLGLLLGLTGFVWFWQKDRHATSPGSNPVLDRDAH